MSFPAWWASDVRVQNAAGQAGVLQLAGPRHDEYWIVRLDGDDSESSYVMRPDPAEWTIEVRQPVTPYQLRRAVYEADRALCHSFGCHYVPAFETLTEGQRTGTASCLIRLTGRPELDGVRALVRAGVREALTPHVRDW